MSCDQLVDDFIITMLSYHMGIILIGTSMILHPHHGKTITSLFFLFLGKITIHDTKVIWPLRLIFFFENALRKNIFTNFAQLQPIGGSFCSSFIVWDVFQVLLFYSGQKQNAEELRVNLPKDIRLETYKGILCIKATNAFSSCQQQGIYICTLQENQIKLFLKLRPSEIMPRLQVDYIDQQTSREELVKFLYTADEIQFGKLDMYQVLRLITAYRGMQEYIPGAIRSKFHASMLIFGEYYYIKRGAASKQRQNLLPKKRKRVGGRKKNQLIGQMMPKQKQPSCISKLFGWWTEILEKNKQRQPYEDQELMGQLLSKEN